MNFALSGLMDEQACYEYSSRSSTRKRAFRIHDRARAPLLQLRGDAKAARRGYDHVFIAFTGTEREGTDKRPSTNLLLLHGFAEGVPSANLPSIT